MPPWEPIITGGANLLGQGLNALFGRKAEERQYNRNVKFWNMQNAYNHPKAQMSRFKDAGLNPNLIYGRGAASAGDAGPIQKVDAQPTNLELGNAATQTLNSMYDTQIKKAQVNNLEAQTQAQNFQNWYEALIAQDKFADLKQGHFLKKAQADKIYQEINNIRQSFGHTLEGMRLGNRKLLNSIYIDQEKFNSEEAVRAAVFENTKARSEYVREQTKMLQDGIPANSPLIAQILYRIAMKYGIKID